MIHTPDNRTYSLTLVLVTIVALVPIWINQYLPLGDYPIHLARCYTLAHYNEVALFQQKYLVVREPIPNIGEEVLIPLFMRVTDVHLAGRIFVSLILILFTYGVHLLARDATGRGRFIAVLAPFLFFCNQFFWGTLNYMFGVGLFFVTFAIWYRSRNDWRAANWIAVLFLVPALYLAHLAAYALMLVACATVLFSDLIRARRFHSPILLSVLPLLTPLMLYAIFMRGTGTVGEIIWATPMEKAIAVVPFLSHHLLIDALLGLMLLTSIGYLIAKREAASLQVHYLMIAAVFFAMFLACPRALYTSFGADVRFLVPAWIFALLAIRLSGRSVRYILWAAVALFVVRQAAIARDWSAQSEVIAGEVAMLDSIPSESRLYPLFNYHALAKERDKKALQFISCYATIDRHAFTPSLIARRGQQPLIWRDSVDARPVIDDPSDSAQNWMGILERYDYLYFLGDSTAYPARLRRSTTQVRTSANGSLWKVDR